MSAISDFYNMPTKIQMRRQKVYNSPATSPKCMWDIETNEI